MLCIIRLTQWTRSIFLCSIFTFIFVIRIQMQGHICIVCRYSCTYRTLPCVFLSQTFWVWDPYYQNFFQFLLLISISFTSLGKTCGYNISQSGPQLYTQKFSVCFLFLEPCAICFPNPAVRKKKKRIFFGSCPSPLFCLPLFFFLST